MLQIFLWEPNHGLYEASAMQTGMKMFVTGGLLISNQKANGRGSQTAIGAALAVVRGLIEWASGAYCSTSISLLLRDSLGAASNVFDHGLREPDHVHPTQAPFIQRHDCRVVTAPRVHLRKYLRVVVLDDSLLDGDVIEIVRVQMLSDVHHQLIERGARYGMPGVGNQILPSSTARSVTQP